jgi:glyoxylase-like metal-dependent hydrolase (beta-lactamase superfamily II)
MTMRNLLEIRSLYHPPTHTWTHLAWDRSTRCAAVVDPVLDYDAASGRTTTKSVAALVDLIEREFLDLRWILETHAHADHLSGAALLKARFQCPVAIGAGIRGIQARFRQVFNLGADFHPDGSQFDRLVEDGDRLPLGDLEIGVLRTPGHTDDSVTYLVGDAAFVGDTLFAPDYGTARCDFPGGDARRLFRSIRRILALGDDVRLHLCHDYPPESRAPRAMVPVAEQRSDNVHVRDGIGEDEFVTMRERRDQELEMPALILPAIQVNIRAGSLPQPEDNGVVYLKIPVDLL